MSLLFPNQLCECDQQKKQKGRENQRQDLLGGPVITWKAESMGIWEVIMAGWCWSQSPTL